MDLKDINNSEIKSAPLETHDEKQKVGFLLGVGIFIMPYIFSWVTLKKGYSNTAKVVSFVWMGILLISFNKGSSDNNRTVSSTVPVQKEEVQQVFVKESCLKLSDTFGVSSQLSDLQKDELWKEYKDQSFEWKLQVTEVSSETLGDGFTVQFKCKGSSAFIQDVMLTYPASAKETVLGFKKGSNYTVKGTLTSFSSFAGLLGDALQ